MSNIIELNSETLFYLKSNDKISGVRDSGAEIDFLNFDNNSQVSIRSSGNVTISSQNLKSLCIAWLSLNYPDVLKYDK